MFELKPKCIFCGSNDNVFELEVDQSLVVNACAGCSKFILNKTKTAYYCQGCSRASLGERVERLDRRAAVIISKCQYCKNGQAQAVRT